MIYLEDANYIFLSSLNLNLFSLKSKDCTVHLGSMVVVNYRVYAIIISFPAF